MKRATRNPGDLVGCIYNRAIAMELVHMKGGNSEARKAQSWVANSEDPTGAVRRLFVRIDMCRALLLLMPWCTSARCYGWLSSTT